MSRRPSFLAMSGEVAAIVPAAGTGSRVGGRRNKLLLTLAGAPLLAHTLQALQDSPAVHSIVVAVRPEDRLHVQALLRRYRVTKALPPVPGGGSRAESVARGFAALPAGTRWVLIHDGARPCLSPALVSRAVREGRRRGAVACGLPASLTVKAADEQGVVRVTLDRDRLWFVQTPQVFRWDWFAQALQRVGFTDVASNGRRAAGDTERFPDDAALLEAAGFPVVMVPGEARNIKVTTKEDFLLAEAILAARATREVKTQKAKVKTTRQKSKASSEWLILSRQF